MGDSEVEHRLEWTDISVNQKLGYFGHSYGFYSRLNGKI